MKLRILGTAFMLMFLASPFVNAAVFNCTGGDVPCLIEAINVANANGEGDTISLAAGTYTIITVDNDTDGPNGTPSITSQINLKSSDKGGAIIQRDAGASPFRIFHVSSIGVLTLENIIVRGGDSPGTGPAPLGQGGGILNLGNLALLNTTIEGNRAEFNGGGIRNFLGAPSLTITSSTMSNNVAMDSGGAIDDDGVWVAISNSTIVQNNSAITGGGIFTAADNFLITNSTITHNSAGFGGGINSLRTVGLINTILDENAAVEIMYKDCVGNFLSLGNNLIGDPGGCGMSLQSTDLTGDSGLGGFADEGTPGNGHFSLLSTSQAIDAGNNEACPLKDQLDDPRVDGNGDGIVTCDIGSIEFNGGPANVNDLVDFVVQSTSLNPNPVPGGPAGVFNITARLTNTSPENILEPINAIVRTLTNGNKLLSATEGNGGSGSTEAIDAGSDDMLIPKESRTVQFRIGLANRNRFSFFVDVSGIVGEGD